jgi:predicted dinucleotide-binding enzyme
MATLGLIGSGHIGGTLARLAVEAGLDVVLSNSRGSQTLSDPVAATDRTALPIAGNDPGAKKQAAQLLSLLGYDTVDIGPLTESWRSQRGIPVFCAPYTVTKDDQYRTQPAAPASATEISAALASARRRITSVSPTDPPRVPAAPRRIGHSPL